jgi:methylated-DNA-[protein]-cysteine S-methyltransferase
MEAVVTYYTKKTQTPVGELKLIASERGLAAILWEDDDPKRVKLEPQVEDEDNDILVETERQLKLYFDGTLKVFSVPFDFVGTEFQTSVWKALLKIPFGQTRTYTQIAKQIGRPTAARAVGAASGKNPISIMAPCHRVVGANGELTGFAGGLETKELLLALERDGDAQPGRAH